RLGLDYDVVSRAYLYCLNPVVQVVKRCHKRIGANPAVRGWPIRIARGTKFYRRIQRIRIVEEISREIVKVIKRLPRMPVASGLRGKGAALKIWHRGTYDRRKLTDLIALRTELGNRVDRHLGIALAYVGRIVPAVTIS